MRYIATYSTFIWADSDEQAIKKAKNLTKALDIDDNRAEIESLAKAPTGSILIEPLNLDE